MEAAEPLVLWAPVDEADPIERDALKVAREAVEGAGRARAGQEMEFIKLVMRLRHARRARLLGGCEGYDWHRLAGLALDHAAALGVGRWGRARLTTWIVFGEDDERAGAAGPSRGSRSSRTE